MNNNNTDVGLGCGMFIAFLMFSMLVSTVVIAVAWNVGLYGAGIVDHKIGFWTALGLAFGLSILRSVLGAGRTAANKGKQ